MVEELIPGVFHWTAFHEGIQRSVHSAFVRDSGVLIDPMEPQEGVDAIGDLGAPRVIVLTNRHHYRHSDRFVERFGCEVLCHEAGLGHFSERARVCGFSFDEQLTDGVRALELASICAEEATLLVDAGGGALCFGDGLTRGEDGSLAFMPDELLGEDPEGVRAGLHRNLRRMCEEDFDTLLFAHAEPVVGEGRMRLGEFLSRAPVAQPS